MGVFKDKRSLRFALLHGLYWSAFCVIYSFLVPLYRHYGFSEVTIGLLSMTGSLASMVIQPLWGLISDKSGSIKGIFIVVVLFSAIIGYGLWLGRFGAAFMYPVAFLIAGTFMSMGAILDSWIIKMSNQGYPVRYSTTRGIGAITFALTSLLFGRMLDATGLYVIPLVFTVMAVLLAVTAAFAELPLRFGQSRTVENYNPNSLGVTHLTGQLAPESEVKSNALETITELVKNKRYVFLVISLMLVFTGNGAAIVFMPVRIAELGGTTADVGFAMMVMALSEAPAMLSHHKIVARIKNEAVLIISLLFFILRIAALGLMPTVTLIIVSQVLSFFSFGLYMPSVIQHLNRIVKAQHLTTALLLFSSGSFGIGMMIGSSVGGVLAEQVGVSYMLLILSLVSSSGFFLHLFTSIKWGPSAVEE